MVYSRDGGVLLTLLRSLVVVPGCSSSIAAATGSSLIRCTAAPPAARKYRVHCPTVRTCNLAHCCRCGRMVDITFSSLFDGRWPCALNATRMLPHMRFTMAALFYNSYSDDDTLNAVLLNGDPAFAAGRYTSVHPVDQHGVLFKRYTALRRAAGAPARFPYAHFARTCYSMLLLTYMSAILSFRTATRHGGGRAWILVCAVLLLLHGILYHMGARRGVAAAPRARLHAAATPRACCVPLCAFCQRIPCFLFRTNRHHTTTTPTRPVPGRTQPYHACIPLQVVHTWRHLWCCLPVCGGGLSSNYVTNASSHDLSLLRTPPAYLPVEAACMNKHTHTRTHLPPVLLHNVCA